MQILLAILLAFFVLGVFVLPTILSFKFTRRMDIYKQLQITLTLWGVKILVLFGLVLLLKGFDFFDHIIFAVFLAVGAVIATIFEALHFKKTSGQVGKIEQSQPTPPNPQSQQWR